MRARVAALWLSTLMWLSTLVAAAAMGESIDGTSVADVGDSIVLSLTTAADGNVTGTMKDSSTSMPVAARRDGNSLRGTVGPSGSGIPFAATLEGSVLRMAMSESGEEEEVVFNRTGTTVTSARNVVINGRRLSDAELAEIEATYGVRLPDNDFWYDTVLGAWGLRGGPTLGFTQPGLTLGGPLPADASGGGTGVYVNGRELHPLDLTALQSSTGPIAPGRYFITAQGLAGYEGGPAQWDLRAAVARANNPSNSWQSSITGASGFSDGETGAVFLPGGDIVSYGQ